MKIKTTLLFLYLILCFAFVNAQTDVLNGGFEQWKLKEFKCCGRNTDIPWYWGVTEQLTGLNYNKFIFRELEHPYVHSGNCSIQLFSDTTHLNNLVLIPGIVAYGQMIDSASTAVTISPVVQSTGLPLPLNSNPVSLNFFMLINHAATDTPYYMYVFTKWDSITQTEDTLAYAQVDIPDLAENMNQWIEYVDTIHYTAPGTADTVRILFFGGRFGNASLQGNSTYLDDVSLFYPGLGVVSLDGEPVLHLYPNPASNLLTIKTGQYKAGNNFQIFDAAGRSLKTLPVETETTIIDISKLAPGNYFYRLAGKANTMLNEGKFVVVR